MNRVKMVADLKAFREAGGLIHVTAIGGCCIHDPPRGGRVRFAAYMPGYTGVDDDWYLDTVRELWPMGAPACPSSKPGEPEA